MKTLISISIGLMAFTMLGAQSNPAKAIRSGKVIYEDKAKVEIHLEGDAAALAASLPKERKSLQSLLFNENASLYANVKKEEAGADEHMSELGGAVVMVKMMVPDNKMYTDFAGKKQIEQREFMTRMFLIEKELGVPDWKLTGNVKDILGYSCQEAVRQPNDSTKIVAWFTPAIPIPSGPGQYLNLPGLVLAVELDNGDHTLIAQSIEEMPVDNKMLAKPKEGKKTTEAEFKKIVDEKMKEMGAEGTGSGTRVMIRIEK
ncbi:MAG: GLPGLI family protein [Porphyromonadaceae bacterium]|nr:MAG: GLPGLI family protein [Porphyromonadaceae bacterium]